MGAISHRFRFARLVWVDGKCEVPEAKTVKNRLHLDVRVGVGLTGDERVTALEAEAARLETLGEAHTEICKYAG